jgi:hypothetical protein
MFVIVVVVVVVGRVEVRRERSLEREKIKKLAGLSCVWRAMARNTELSQILHGH